MRKWNMIYRSVATGLQNFIRNSWLTLAATMVMVVAITVVLAGFILNVTAKNIITNLSQQLTVSVYFKEEASQQDINQLQIHLQLQEEVNSVLYVSPQVAQERLLNDFNQDSRLVEAIGVVDEGGEGFLPPSIEVSVSDLSNIDKVIELVSQANYSDVVDETSLGKTDAQKTIDKASSLQNFLVQMVAILAIVFASISFMIIFNTIRLAIFSRREEVKIMRLVGASPHFIKAPFIVEATLCGLIAGIIALSLVYGPLIFFEEQLISNNDLIDSYNYFTKDIKVILTMIGGAIGGGVAVGLFSCNWALRRHLKLNN